MLPIAVGRLHHEIVRAVAWGRVEHGGAIVSAEIAREDESLSAPFKLNGSGTRDMARVSQVERRAAGHRADAVKRDGRQVLERGDGVSQRIKRERWLVLGETMAVRKFGVLLLKMA